MQKHAGGWGKRRRHSSADHPSLSYLARILFMQRPYYLRTLLRLYCSLRASSPIWASEASLSRTRERAAKPRSRVLTRLTSLAQIGELTPRLAIVSMIQYHRVERAVFLEITMRFVLYLLFCKKSAFKWFTMGMWALYPIGTIQTLLTNSISFHQPKLLLCSLCSWSSSSAHFSSNFPS